MAKRPPPATNGRFVPMPETGEVLPASSPRANVFRPLSGSSRILRFSMTWPSEEVDDSTSGAEEVTSTVSETPPTSSAIRMLTV